MKNFLLFTLIIFFALGIVLEEIFSIGIFFILFLVLLGCSLLIFYYFFFDRTPSDKSSRGIFLFVLFFLGVGVGMARGNISEITLPSVLNVPQKVNAVGIISSEPDRRETNTELTVTIEKLNLEDASNTAVTLPKDLKVLLFASHYETYHYGERIRFIGTLKKPEDFETNGRTFHYVNYLAKDGIAYVMHYPETTVLSSGNGNPLKASLFALKEAFLSNISALIPEPEASLEGGLVVGAKHSLGQDLLNDFRRVGVIHVVVLSGYNVSLIADFIQKIFSFLPGIFAGLLGGVGIVLFVIMAGGTTTAVRAGAMALLVVLARQSGRTFDTLRLLFLVGAGMVLWNPKILLYDPSFQLSFLATFGLLVFSPVVTRWLWFLPEKWNIREIASATIATQIFVLPVILYMMGNVSLISVPVNLLVLIFVPLTMLLGFLAGVLGFITLPLALPFAYIAYLFLSYEIGAVTFFSGIPFASFMVPAFSLWIVFFWYLLYLVGYLSYRKFGDRMSFYWQTRRELSEWKIVEVAHDINE